jgi:uncharacterized protein YjbJ (UPF0337 family)
MPRSGDELKGAVKQTVGKVLGNERLQAEGAADQATGKAVRETAGAGNQLGGTVKRAAGRALGSRQLELEGEAQRLKGQAQSAG